MRKLVDIPTVLAQFLPAYQAHHRVDARRRQVLTHLGQCRTAALGGFALHCARCDERRILYHAVATGTAQSANSGRRGAGRSDKPSRCYRCRTSTSCSPCRTS